MLIGEIPVARCRNLVEIWGFRYSQYVWQKDADAFLRDHRVNYPATKFFLYNAMQTVHSPLEVRIYRNFDTDSYSIVALQALLLSFFFFLGGGGLFPDFPHLTHLQSC